MALLQYIPCKEKADSILVIKVGDVSFFYIQNEIVYVNSGKTSFPTSFRSLKYVEERVDSNFFKVHKKYLISLAKMKRFTNHFQRVSMDDGTSIPISRRNWRKLKTRLGW